MLKLRLHYGKLCPPKATVYGWVSQRAAGLFGRVGRPRMLSMKEEEELLACMALARSRGVVLDRETVILMAQRVTSSMRPGQDPADCQLLSKDWVTSLKKRHGLSNLRACTTDRPPSTAADRQEENDWREDLQKVLKNPRQFGCNCDEFTKDTTLAMDETPLQYCPKGRGTFQLPEESNRGVYIANGADKRQATATPVVTLAGELLLLQVIWRGKTSACHAKTTVVDPKIVQMHTEKKMQVFHFL